MPTKNHLTILFILKGSKINTLKNTMRTTEAQDVPQIDSTKSV